MAGGALMGGAGALGLGLIAKTLPAAKEYANQLSLMDTLGMKQADIAKVVGQAWKTSFDVPTSTVAENLKSFREVRSAFGSTSALQGEAAAMVPLVARMQGILTALTGKAQDRVGFDMVKAIELRTGVMTPGAMASNAQLMSQALIGMGGTLTVSDFHQALKQGRMATAKWDNAFTYRYLPTLMQELKTGGGGGGQAGTALMSFYQQAHGRMQKSALPLWLAAGLIRPDDVVRNATGSYQVKPGAVAGTALMETNPYLRTQRYLRPAVDKLAAEKRITPESVINSMFSNRLSGFAAYTFYQKSAQFDRDKLTISKADGSQAYEKLLATNPAIAQLRLQAQLVDAETSLAKSSMPLMIKSMKGLSGALATITKVLNRHPRQAEAAMVGTAGLSGLLIAGAAASAIAALVKSAGVLLKVFSAVGAIGPALEGAAGGFTVLGAAIAGISAPVWGTAAAIAAGVAGVGVAIYQMWKHWDKAKSVLANIRSELGMFWTWLLSLPAKLWAAIPQPMKNLLGAPALVDQKGGPWAGTHLAFPSHGDHTKGLKTAQAGGGRCLPGRPQNGRVDHPYAGQRL